MALINLKSLGVTLGVPLFENVDLAVRASDRRGIVAANGRGKSTLLRCIAGGIEPTSGEITRSRGLRIGHVEQDMPAGLLSASFHNAVLRALPAEQAETEAWRVDVVLDSLDVPPEPRERPLAQLSGGWQRLAMLARVWVCEHVALLLEAPTHHHDIRVRSQLEEWLNALQRNVPVL